MMLDRSEKVTYNMLNKTTELMVHIPSASVAKY